MSQGYVSEAREDARRGGPFSTLSFGRLVFRLQALSSGKIPRHPGALLRGAFGAALRSISCPENRRDCDDCAIDGSCAYRYLFETPRPSHQGDRGRGDRIPHPFVLRPWKESTDRVVEGDQRELEVVLIGRALKLLPHVVVAVERMGRVGLGRGNVVFQLDRVEQLGAFDSSLRNALFSGGGALHEIRAEVLTPESWQSGEPLDIELISPAHVVADGRPMRSLGSQSLVRALLRRTSSLSHFHCGKPLDLDYPTMLEAARSLRVVDHVRYVRFSRYSFRQRQEIPYSGVVGRARLEGETLGELGPLLALGQVLHVGKGTSFGLGWYRIHPADARQEHGDLSGPG